MPWTQSDLNAYHARQMRQPSSSTGVELESDLHDQILAECRRRGWIALHSRMDMAATITVGAPDFIILAECKIYLVECKRRDGKPSPKQLALHAWAAKLGHAVHVVRSLEEFNQILSPPQRDP